MSVTIKDVAVASGVSIGTVDRVLHNRAYVNVNVRKRVLREIERLGYVANRNASILSTGARKVIGLICPVSPTFFWDEVANGALASAKSLNSMGIDLEVRRIANYFISTDFIIETIGELIDQKVDMIIMAGPNCSEIYEVIVKTDLPFAFINIDYQGADNKIFYIGPDERKCGRIAAGMIGRFLKRSGNILVMCPAFKSTPLYVSYIRLKGFEDALQEYFPQVKITDVIYYADSDGAAYQELFSSCLRKQPDAVYLPDGYALNLIGCELRQSCSRDRPIIVGHEFNEQIRVLLENDYIDATISQSPYRQGTEAIRCAYLYLFDGLKPKNGIVSADLSIITREAL